ncbi:LysR substrate binding domain protein [Acetobacteraceae bacterium AT-5844]|nr:LysR substrate binding domain protein [Acetobacteraceae bacterium AT-5844]
MTGIELRHLRCLVAIAEEGSFSRAAQRLGTTQPAVSQLLKRMEDVLGALLVRRDRVSVCLTGTGEEVLQQARRALAAVEGVVDTAQRNQRGEAGRLRIGLATPSLYGVVPGLIRRFRERHPGVSVELRVLATAEQGQALRERRVDMGFGISPLHREDDVRRYPLAAEAMQVVMPVWHPLAGRHSLSMAMLREEAWIMPPLETIIRTDIQKHCQEAGFFPRIAAESADFQSTFGLVMAGAGIAMAAESFGNFSGPDLVMLPLQGSAPRLVHVLAHLEGELTPAAAALLRMAAEEFGVEYAG